MPAEGSLNMQTQFNRGKCVHPSRSSLHESPKHSQKRQRLSYHAHSGGATLAIAAGPHQHFSPERSDLTNCNAGFEANEDMPLAVLVSFTRKPSIASTPPHPKALATKGSSDNYHTISVLEPLLPWLDVVKVDIEWAGYCIFLCHHTFSHA